MIVFSEQELKNLEEFETEHSICYRKPDAKSKRVEFIIRHGATGIGMNTYIKCCCCGEEKDVTDYECW